MNDKPIPITVAFLPNTEVGLVLLRPEAAKLLATGKYKLVPAIKTGPEAEIVGFAIVTGDDLAPNL